MGSNRHVTEYQNGISSRLSSQKFSIELGPTGPRVQQCGPGEQARGGREQQQRERRQRQQQ